MDIESNASDIVAAFVQPSPKLYLALSEFCRRGRESAEGGDSVSRIFQPIIASKLSESKQDDLLAAVTFHRALFQVDWQAASQIFTADGFVELVATLESDPSPPVLLSLARLYAQASSHKACRQVFAEDSIAWLRAKSSQTTDDGLRAAAILALVKLTHGSSGEEAVGTVVASAQEDVAHAAQLSDMIMTSKDVHACLNEAVEGLAHLSINSSVKKSLTDDDAILTRLFSLVPTPKAVTDATGNSALVYGVLVIISNLCAHKPQLSQEQRQIAKLRQMAESGQKMGRQEGPDPLESERQVQARCRSAINCGALDVLSTASTLDSHGIRSSVGEVLLSLVENKEDRGEILKGGGSRTLARIIRSASSPGPIPQEALPAIQALAKLAITAPPIQVFGPNEGNVLDAIRPFTQLLLHPSASMLQQFEATMALTNLASHSPALASRITNTPHVLGKVEFLMLEDHTLIRRAATELVCNLIGGSEHVFERYAGTNDEATQTTSHEGSSKSRIHVLIAMSDVDDLSTRLAASGALAMLTSAQTACEAILALQREHHRAFLVLVGLLDPSVHAGENAAVGDSGLVHRGVVCIHNLVSNLSSRSHRDVLKEQVNEAGFLVVFEKLLRGELGSFADAVLAPARDVKKKLIDLLGN